MKGRGMRVIVRVMKCEKDLTVHCWLSRGICEGAVSQEGRQGEKDKRTDSLQAPPKGVSPCQYLEIPLPREINFRLLTSRKVRLQITIVLSLLVCSNLLEQQQKTNTANDLPKTLQRQARVTLQIYGLSNQYFYTTM